MQKKKEVKSIFTGKSFSNPKFTYQPCGFFNACNLKKTLINGIHHPHQQEVDPSWQTSEI
jgi:hypothetical protein